MFTVSILTTFTAGHQLKFPSGSEPYHIHDWQVEAAVGGEKLDENGLLLDFNRLKKTLDDILAPFDQQALEEFDCFKNVNTSAENVAEYIFFSVKKQLPDSISLLYVEVTEAPNCKASYSEKPF